MGLKEDEAISMPLESAVRLRTPLLLRPPLEAGPDVDCDDDELLQKNKEYRYVPEKMTWDPNWLVTIVS